MEYLGPALPAEAEHLPIGVDDGVGEKHHAIWVLAVAEAKGVPDLVDSLLGGSLTEKLRVWRFTVKFGPQPKKRYNG